MTQRHAAALAASLRTSRCVDYAQEWPKLLTIYTDAGNARSGHPCVDRARVSPRTSFQDQRYAAQALSPSTDVGRERPSSDALCAAFRIDATPTQRRLDGTMSLAGTRFEIPSAYRHARAAAIRVLGRDPCCYSITATRQHL